MLGLGGFLIEVMKVISGETFETRPLCDWGPPTIFFRNISTWATGDFFELSTKLLSASG